MKEPKKEKDILQALDEMEEVSSELNSRKARVQDRIKKHVKPVKEVSKDELIRQRTQAQDEQEIWALKKNLALWGTIIVVAEVFAYRSSNGDTVDMVVYHAVALVSLGKILIRKKNFPY